LIIAVMRCLYFTQRHMPADRPVVDAPVDQELGHRI
jgi:hypothetical protein